MSEELDRNAILSQDNPDGDVFADVAPETVTQPAEETQPEQQTQEQQQEQTTPATSDANPFDEGSAQHKAFERVREAERAKADAERELAITRAIQARDAEWQQSMRQQQQEQPANDPYVDPLDDPEGHAAWVQRQIAREVAQVKQEFDKREQQRQQAEYQRETQRLMAEAGAPVETLQSALAHVQQSQPWMIAGLNQAPNPFKAVLDYAKSIGFNAPNAAPVTPSTSDAIPDHIRQQVLAEEARKRAAAGASPQTTMPRGVGSVPSGAGFSDALPPPSEFHKLSAAEYAAVKAKVLGQ